MKSKVILMSIDGMRPDGLAQCGNPYVEQLKKEASYTFAAQTVFPSVTLPCHMSLFYSLPPMRHGVTSNTFVPQVHHVTGLFEKLKAYGSVNAFFYGWEPLRDVAPPASCKFATYINAYMDESVDTLLTDEAMGTIRERKPDFVFLYQVETDEKGGHDAGWMTDEYLRRIHIAIGNAKRVIEEFGDEYTVIITADHGGHDRMHGSDLPEDMTIPMFFRGPQFEAGRELEGVSILDITPTIASLMGVEPEREWEGKALC